MRILFVCNWNINRSKTAEEMFRGSFETRSRGLFDHLVTEDDMRWADVVCVVEEQQKGELTKRFPAYERKTILNLEIPNRYSYNSPELKALLRKRMIDLKLLHPDKGDKEKDHGKPAAQQ
jgi:predicted protein tyrosine phosphatase